MTVLREVLGDSLRKKNVPGIAAIHHPLRDIDSSAGNVGLIVHIGDAIDRPAVNSHAQLNLRMTFQRITDLERTFYRRFRIGEKSEHHPITSRQTNQFFRPLPRS